MDPPVDVEIASCAARQRGNITRQQLFALGLNDNAIDLRLMLGRLHRVHLGVYSVGNPARTQLELAAAAVLACGPGAAVSHGSALGPWGFARGWAPSLHVTVPGDRDPAGVRVHRSRTLSPRNVRTRLGIRLTSPARTLLDCAPP
jgi:predicted transcriptional regulator of viral defense system